MFRRLTTAIFLLIFNTLAITQVYADDQPVDPKLRQLLTDAINSAESFDDRFHAEVWLLDMSNRLKRFIDDE
jgi:hypothetical protein